MILGSCVGHGGLGRMCFTAGEGGEAPLAAPGVVGGTTKTRWKRKYNVMKACFKKIKLN